MDDAIQYQPATPRPPSRRVVLWDELEQLHAQLGMAPPTATYVLEDLEAEVERLRSLAGAEQDADGGARDPARPPTETHGDA
jgi:hypothetical protein